VSLAHLETLPPLFKRAESMDAMERSRSVALLCPGGLNEAAPLPYAPLLRLAARVLIRGGAVREPHRSEPLSVLVAGLGGRGRQWLEILARCDNAAAVCGVDPDPGARYAASRYLGGPVLRLFPTLDIALKNCSAAAAIICTPVFLHEETTLACLEAGMGVLLEKPFAGSAAAAHAMTERAADLDLPLIIAQNYRYAMPARAVEGILKAGLIGKPGFGQCVSHMCRRNPVSPCAHLSYAQLDMAVHHFDMLRCVLDAECVSVRARAFNTPWSFFDHGAGIEALLAFDGGVEMTYVGSWASRANRFSLRVEGAGGFLTCEDERVRYTAAGRILPGRAPAADMHPLDRLKAPYGGMHALIEELRAALAGDRTTPNRAEANLGTLGMALACALSDREGREVSLAEALSPDADVTVWDRPAVTEGADR
jgi:predicted dehydrogenase